MAIAAQRFKFLDEETNVAIKSLEGIFDNAVYNRPDIDSIFQETAENLLSSITGGDLINSLKDSLPSFDKIDIPNLEKTIANMINQPEIMSALTSSLDALNISPNNISSTINSLTTEMSKRYAKAASTVCSPFNLLNSLLKNLQNSLLGQLALLLSKNHMVRLSNGACPILKNTAIPIKLPKSDKALKAITTITKPIDILKFIENDKVKIINQPNTQNRDNIWTSKDTHPYIKFPSNVFKEKEILIVNKILLYRAIYYKYEREIDPATNPNVHTYDATAINNLINSYQYQSARDNIATSNATKADLASLSQQIRSTFNTDPEALSIAADIENNRIQSYTQIQEKKYMYYINRYFELVKEFVDNPTYINTINSYTQYVNSNMPQESKNYYTHVTQLYNFYKSNRSTLNTSDPASIYTSMVKNAPSSLSSSEIDILVSNIPNDTFNKELDYGMPTPSDKLYAA